MDRFKDRLCLEGQDIPPVLHEIVEEEETVGVLVEVTDWRSAPGKSTMKEEVSTRVHRFCFLAALAWGERECGEHRSSEGEESIGCHSLSCT